MSGAPPTAACKLSTQSKNVQLIMRVTASEVRPYNRGAGPEEMVSAVGVVDGGDRVSVAFFGKAADVGKELHVGTTYLLKGGFCKIPHETSLSTVLVDVIFDRACDKSVAPPVIDEVSVKRLSSVLASLGDIDGASVVVDMKGVVVNVLGHSQVVQKKDGSPLDRFLVRARFVCLNSL